MGSILGTGDSFESLSEFSHLAPGSIMVTMDASALHTNIPHADGLDAINSLVCHSHDAPDVIVKLNRFSWAQSVHFWRSFVRTETWHCHEDKNGSTVRRFVYGQTRTCVPPHMHPQARSVPQKYQWYLHGWRHPRVVFQYRHSSSHNAMFVSDHRVENDERNIMHSISIAVTDRTSCQTVHSWYNIVISTSRHL